MDRRQQDVSLGGAHKVRVLMDDVIFLHLASHSRLFLQFTCALLKV